jgi:hypothetical protein
MDLNRLPDALRPTELNDFSDLFHEADGRVNRPLVTVLVLALLLTVGHFAYETLMNPAALATAATTEPAGTHGGQGAWPAAAAESQIPGKG